MKVPAHLANIFQVNTEDLSAGVSGGFSVLSFRASKWRIKHQGNETLVTNSEGEAVPSVEVIMLRASKSISKIWYETAYADGSNAAPDCLSVDGITPDAGAQKPQSKACATCKWNQWGSKITPAGKKSKACSDHRRMAVTPVGDIPNSAFGGPMLLRIPPASLTDLSLYGQKLGAKGFAYNAVVTRLGFDPDASYPKLTFKAVRPLTDDELEQVAELFQGDTIGRILSEASELETAEAPATAAAPAVVQEAVDVDFEMDAPPPVAAPQPAPAPAKPVKAAGPKPVPVKAAPAPVAAPAPAAEEDVLTAELDDMIASLDALDG
jgi:hypothetical protein